MIDIKAIENDIYLKILNITKKEIKNDNVNLLGKPYNLHPRSLVYLFMEIQQEYNIEIPEEFLRNQQFATIKGITEIIVKCLHKVETVC